MRDFPEAHAQEELPVEDFDDARFFGNGGFAGRRYTFELPSQGAARAAEERPRLPRARERAARRRVFHRWLRERLRGFRGARMSAAPGR